MYIRTLVWCFVGSAMCFCCVSGLLDPSALNNLSPVDAIIQASHPCTRAARVGDFQSRFLEPFNRAHVGYSGARDGQEKDRLSIAKLFADERFSGVELEFLHDGYGEDGPE